MDPINVKHFLYEHFLVSAELLILKAWLFSSRNDLVNYSLFCLPAVFKLAFLCLKPTSRQKSIDILCYLLRVFLQVKTCDPEIRLWLYLF